MCLFNSKEAAEYLNVSKATVDRLRKGGKLGFTRIGKLVRFDLTSHLETFIKQNGK